MAGALDSMTPAQVQQARQLVLWLCELSEEARMQQLAKLSQEEVQALWELGPRHLDSGWVPSRMGSNFKQWVFLSQLMEGVPDLFYGGAAGGGKSEAILAAALQYVHVPGYAALLLRREYVDLTLPGSLIPRSKEWLMNTEAKWNEQLHQWTFPSGAVLRFGHMKSEDDKYQYQSSEWQFIGVDEAGQLTATQLEYIGSRLRRPTANKLARAQLASVPLRMRLTSNPGGPSHNHLKGKYIDPHMSGTLPEGLGVIRATMQDNPYLDVEAYDKQLAAMRDPVERQRLRVGDWDISARGGTFQRGWFRVQASAPAGMERMVRAWDKAASEPSPAYPDPDWTAGVLMGLKDDTVYVLDLIHMRGTPGKVKAVMLQAAQADGRRVAVRWEEEGGSSGKDVSEDLGRLLLGFAAKGVRSTGSKAVRAQPLASAAEAGRVVIVSDWKGLGHPAPWVSVMLDQLQAVFMPGQHDDIADAMAMAFNELTHTRVQRKRPVPIGMPAVVGSNMG